MYNAIIKIKWLFISIVLCGKQNIAIRGHEENKGNYLAILQYRAKSDELLQKHLNDKTKKTRYLSPKIQNELLDMSAEQIRRDIVRDCNNAACFALIADEATDSSTKEQISLLDLLIDRLTVILRFVKNSLDSCRLKVLKANN
jgi:hypothetical protein